MLDCGSDYVRRRKLPCRSGKAVYWRAALPLGHATTFAAARWRRAHRGPRRGTSSCRYRCRSRRIALANKLARIAWAVLAKGRAFELTRTNDVGVRPA